MDSIRVISEIKPQNDSRFAVLDSNNIRGGYIHVNTLAEMQSYLQYTDLLKEGMLCYSKENSEGTNMFQLLNNNWTPLVITGEGGGSSVKVVATLADLDLIEIKHKGQLVFIEEIKELRMFNGVFWESLSKIYIQPTPPDDTGGIWINNSMSRLTPESDMITMLTKAVSVLTRQVEELQATLYLHTNFGGFDNNQMLAYKDAPSIKPPYGSSVEEDLKIQAGFIENGISLNKEPVELKDTIKKGTHLTFKLGTYSDMVKYQKYFLAGEPLWCDDREELWIKNKKGKLVKIGSTSGPVDPPTEDMEGILTELINGTTRITGIEFADMSNKSSVYRVRIVDGQWSIENTKLDINSLAGNSQVPTLGLYYKDPYFPISASEVGTITSPKIYSNMVYCGGDNQSKDYSPVSHNFIELCNLGFKDINLKGLYLHYTEKDTGDWVTLPLRGVIKSQGTFLIRGSQCSVLKANTTLIKVGKPDIEWTKEITYNNERLEVQADALSGVQAHTIWGEDNKIKFSTSCSFYISGEESPDFYKSNVLNNKAPWSMDGVLKWYVDLVGFGTYKDKSMPNEGAAIATTGNNIFHFRYFNMDPVSQATKATTARKNSTEWAYINMNNINPKIDINEYTPKASFDNKTIFFNKTLLQEGKPNIITCTLGSNAHTTRCFNWVSVGYYDEFIRYKKEGESNWTTVESFKAGDNRPALKNRNHEIYNRIRSITTDGTPFTTHKCIIDFVEPASSQKYIYQVGREGAWSEDRSFILKGRQHCITNGFNFLQVSDQQGFTEEEYETWRVCAELINSNKSTYNYDFCINTGDATQNGNRINEWVDYFRAGDSIFKENAQMYTIGNNDLCPLDVYTLGDGSEVSKTSPMNVMFFFTFEHPNTVPIADSGIYIPCIYSFVYGDTYYLCANSEIPEVARTEYFKDVEGSHIYTTIKNWCVADLASYASDSAIKWKVAYCHESPFTIITADLVMKYLKSDGAGGFTKDPAIKRAGSRINTVGNYWFSQFLQDNDFKLCMCGHKHTYSNSRYLRDNMDKTMEPTIYDPAVSPAWYNALPDREKNLCQLSQDTSVNYVRYVMCQATGFKLTSNKELPAQNIPWLMEYYPVISQVENPSNNTVTVKVNPAQQYPNYIVWSIGQGTETETGTTASRDRIKGKSYKVMKQADTTVWSYKYNVPIEYTELRPVDSNGGINASHNIIIEKTL